MLGRQGSEVAGDEKDIAVPQGVIRVRGAASGAVGDGVALEKHAGLGGPVGRGFLGEQGGA